MTKQLKTIFWILIAVSTSSLHAQTILSSKGVGSPYLLNNSRSMGMGGTSIAMSDPITINRINPATLSLIRNTRLSLEYMMIQNTYETAEGEATSSYSNFNGFSFVVPLGYRFGFSAGLLPVTRMNYNLTYLGTSGGKPYSRTVKGTGGLNAFSLAMSLRILKNLCIGFSGRYIFGNLKEYWVLAYDEENFVDSDDNFTTKNNGFGWTLGLIFSPRPGTEIGAIYTPLVNLENETETFYTYYNLGIASKLQSGSIAYPSSWGVGISQRFLRTIQLGIDYTQTDWTALEINDISVDKTIQTRRIAIGCEIRKTLNPNRSLLERIAYRFGYFTQPYFHQDVEGNDIREHWISAGFGIPLLRNASQVDIAFQYGLRGNLETNSISEKLFRLNLSISGGEKWFIKRY